MTNWHLLLFTILLVLVFILLVSFIYFVYYPVLLYSAYLYTFIAQVVRVISTLFINTVKHITVVLPNISTFIFAIISFVVFLIWNGGIVLGDRSNHLAGLHFPQLFYYTSFLSFFAAPWTLSITTLYNMLTIKRLLVGIASSIISLYLIHHYTQVFVYSLYIYIYYHIILTHNILYRYEHPFLLSDNRHYSFYIWKKIYKRHWAVRYLLTPVYIISSFLNIHVFGKCAYIMTYNLIDSLFFCIVAQHTSFLVSLGYLFALILTLVPSPLLEFRYFIIPFLFYMVHIPPPTAISRTVIALLLYSSIHVITIYLFLYKPFTWPSEPNQFQRFMW